MTADLSFLSRPVDREPRGLLSPTTRVPSLPPSPSLLRLSRLSRIATWWLIKSPKTSAGSIESRSYRSSSRDRIPSHLRPESSLLSFRVESSGCFWIDLPSDSRGSRGRDKYEVAGRVEIATWEERFVRWSYIYFCRSVTIDRYRVLSLFCPVESSRMMPNWRRPRSPRNGPIQFRLPGRLGSVRDRPYTRYTGSSCVFLFFSLRPK